MRASPQSRDRSLWIGLAAVVVVAMGALTRWVGSARGLTPLAFDDLFPAGPWAIGFWTIIAFSGVVTLASALRGDLRWTSEDRGQVASAENRKPLATALHEVGAGVRGALEGPEPDVPRVLDEILRGALVVEASDIHFNPGAAQLRVAYRVDGVLHDVVALPSPASQRTVSRIKVLSYLDTFSKEPQDGSLRRRVGGVDVEARVSTLPANHGERVVLRLVRGTEVVPNLRQLGFDRTLSFRLEELLQKPQGMLYVSGPVGSGKTTTLYSAMQHVHESRGETTSLVTLEDPIEMQLSFATQTQINSKVGLGFAAALRSVLRQDPGAIMLGEVRDEETAQIATQAGLTGHLILTTIHVQSAAGIFDRLVDMDVERFVLASSCLGSLAQRLVRSLCVECRAEAKPNQQLQDRFRELGVDLRQGAFFEPVGCPACEGRGYSGRLPVAELLVMSEALRSAVQRGASREEVHALAVAEGMVPILNAAMSHAVQGRTSLLEVLRVAG